MKYTLLFAMFLGVTIAQHEASQANNVSEIEKRTCNQLKRWASVEACNADGCSLCVSNVVVCNVSANLLSSMIAARASYVALVTLLI